MVKLLNGVVITCVFLLGLCGPAMAEKPSESSSRPLVIYPWSLNLQTVSVGAQVDRWVLDPKISFFFKPVNYLPAWMQQLVGSPGKMPLGASLSTELRIVGPKEGMLGMGVGLFLEISGSSVVYDISTGSTYTGGNNGFIFGLKLYTGRWPTLGFFLRYNGYYSGLKDARETLNKVTDFGFTGGFQESITDEIGYQELGTAMHLYVSDRLDLFVDGTIFTRMGGGLGDTQIIQGSLVYGFTNRKLKYIRQFDRHLFITLGVRLDIFVKGTHYYVTDGGYNYSSYLNVGM